MNIKSPNLDPSNQQDALRQISVEPALVYERHGEYLTKAMYRGEHDGEPDAYQQYVKSANRFEYEDQVTYELEIVEHQPDGQKDIKIMLVDEDSRGEALGYGVIAYVSGNQRFPALNNKPYVGDTETVEKFRRLGHGERRLRLMNEIAQQRWGQPLESDPRGNTEKEAALVWQKLVRNDEAEQVGTPSGPRWKFIN